VAQEFELGGEAQAGKGPLRTNIFCRLIPVSELRVENTEVKTKEGDEKTAAMATMVPGEQSEEVASLPAVPGLAVVDPYDLPSAVNAPRPERITFKPGASLLCARFLLYWRAIGSSFELDWRQFVEQCREWRGELKGIGGAGSSAPNWYRAVRFMRSWLLGPFGSTTIAHHRQRKSSAGLKHF